MLAFGVLLLAALVLLLLRPARVDSRAGDPAQTADSVQPQQERRLDAPVTSPARSAIESGSADVHASPPISAPKKRGLEFRVVHHMTGTPIPGADAFVLDLSPETIERGYYRELGTLIDRAVESGLHTSSDESGLLELAYGRSPRCVFVRKDELAGMAFIEPDRLNERELKLQEDWPLEVRVIDHLGAPRAGIPVAFKNHSSHGVDIDLALASTGDDGHAVFQHVGLLRALDPEGIHVMRIALALDPPVEVSLESNAGPGRPSTLVLPPLGEIEVQVQNEDGTAWLAPTPLTLVADRIGTPHEADWTARSRQIESRNGIVLVRDVALNSWITVNRQQAGGSSAAEGPGPTSPGERVQLLLTIHSPSRVAVLRGRLVDEQGQPVGRCQVGIAQSFGDPIVTNFYSVATDPSGVFQLNLDPNPSGTTTYHFICREHAFAFGTPPHRGSVRELSGPLTDGPTDLGNVVLQDLPLICEGRVSDHGGTPVPDARLYLSSDVFRSGVLLGWFFAVSDGDGRFRVQGFSDVSSLNLHAHRPDIGEAKTTFQLGATGIELVLSAAAQIVGSISMPATISVGKIELRDRLIGPLTQRNREQLVHPEIASGEFTIAGLIPGEHEVRLGGRNLVGLPVLLASVMVHPGEVVRDPRLQRIDVGSLLRRFDLQVRRPTSVQASPIWLRARVVGDTKRRRGIVDMRGSHVTLLSASDELDVEVRAADCRTRTFVCRPGQTSITLDRGYAVRLELTESTPPPPYSVLPILVNAQDRDEELNWTGLPFDRAGQVTLLLPDAGTYEVVAYLRRGESVVEDGRIGEFAQHITVADVDALQMIKVEIPRSALDHALEVARK